MALQDPPSGTHEHLQSATCVFCEPYTTTSCAYLDCEITISRRTFGGGRRHLEHLLELAPLRGGGRELALVRLAPFVGDVHEEHRPRDVLVQFVVQRRQVEAIREGFQLFPR
eukprot:7573177-Pyramimonas_sp.AAC.3